MNIIVMKFGGTSLGTVDKIRNVAKIVENESKSNKIIVVLSAMAGVTNKLQNYIDEIESEPSAENDLILTSGEQVSIALLSMALHELGVPAVSMTGTQVGIVTESSLYLNKWIAEQSESKGNFGKSITGEGSIRLETKSSIQDPLRWLHTQKNNKKHKKPQKHKNN